jgi:aarF domain-containing kinase
MPNWQMEVRVALTYGFPTRGLTHSGPQRVMASSLGSSWRSSFADFNPIPFAAASIGQVHQAVLAASVSPTGRPARVAVKVQFPNIAESLASDLSYIRILLTAGRLLPRGLFLDKTLAVRRIPRAPSLYVQQNGVLTTVH